MLHSDNSESGDTTNRLRKLKPLLDNLQRMSKALFYPWDDFVREKTVASCVGRLIFRQHMPNKIHHSGVKIEQAVFN